MGIGVADTLTIHSPKIVDEELTRHFQEEMDEIRAEKKTTDEIIKEAKNVLTEVLDDFKKNEKAIGQSLLKAKRETEQKDTLGKCPNCKEGKLLTKRGRFGRFVACDKYPDCKTTFKLPSSGFVEATNKTCKDCGVPLISVKFKGRKPQEMCMNPKCSGKPQIEDSGEEKPCDKCKDGVMKLRSSMYGQFYGCSNYPKCKNTEKIAKEKKKE